jgi:RNA polymerase sigma-70 factor (ECF subfamily)
MNIIEINFAEGIMEERENNRNKRFEILFKQYHTRLYFFACSIINDATTAEDIVEDVFSYLWENYDNLESKYPILPFLYSSTRNRCIDYLRHCDVQDRFREVYVEQLNEENKMDDESFTHHERIENIMNAIKALSPQTRKVFEACFLDGKKYKEVGEEMNISVNTVKTYIARALLYIRREIGQIGEID